MSVYCRFPVCLFCCMIGWVVAWILLVLCGFVVLGLHCWVWWTADVFVTGCNVFMCGVFLVYYLQLVVRFPRVCYLFVAGCLLFVLVLCWVSWYLMTFGFSFGF